MTPKKINYFNLLGLEENGSLDEKVLLDRYLIMQKKNHPDTHSTGDSDLAMQINLAYTTLKNKISRIEYVLQYHDIDISCHKLEEAFMEDMMELHDQKESSANIKELQARYSHTLEISITALDKKNYAVAADFLVRAKYIASLIRAIQNQ